MSKKGDIRVPAPGPPPPPARQPRMPQQVAPGLSPRIPPGRMRFPPPVRGMVRPILPGARPPFPSLQPQRPMYPNYGAAQRPAAPRRMCKQSRFVT